MPESVHETYDLPMIPFFKKLSLLVFVVIFGYYFLLPSNLGFHALFPDSDQYNQFASEISGVDWRRLSADEVPNGRLHRSIGYPFLLSLGLNASDGELFGAHYKTHFGLWAILIAVAITCLSLSEALVFIPILCVLTLVLRPYFILLMTEWIVFVLFSLAGIFYLKFLRHPSSLRVALVSLILGALAAVRLEFIITIPVLQWFLRSQDRRVRFASFLISLILPLSTVGFNVLDQGKLTLRELPKAGLFYLTTGLMLDNTSFDLEVSKKDEYKLIRELMEIQKNKWERFTAQDFWSYALLDPSGIFRVSIHNDSLVEEYKIKEGFGDLEKYRIEGKISDIIISNNLYGYILLVLAGSSIVLLSIILLLSLSLFIKKQTYVWETILFLGVAHIFRIAFISFVNIQYPRYYVPSLAVVLLFAVFAHVNSIIQNRENC